MRAAMLLTAASSLSTPKSPPSQLPTPLPTIKWKPTKLSAAPALCCPLRLQPPRLNRSRGSMRECSTGSRTTYQCSSSAQWHRDDHKRHHAIPCRDTIAQGVAAARRERGVRNGPPGLRPGGRTTDRGGKALTAGGGCATLRQPPARGVAQRRPRIGVLLHLGWDRLWATRR